MEESSAPIKDGRLYGSRLMEPAIGMDGIVVGIYSFQWWEIIVGYSFGKAVVGIGSYGDNRR